MSVFYIVGKPGGGKTYVAVRHIVEEFLDKNSRRSIVTNIDLNRPELGAFLHLKARHEVNLHERLRILNESETAEFYLYEPFTVFDKRREYRMKLRGKGAERVYDVPDFSDRSPNGTLYVIDEVHIFFGAREWQQTGPDMTYFLSQHRKMNCDVVLITQHPEQTDKALRRLAQEYMTVRNLSREPIFGFRLGNMFRYIRTLNSPQSPNPAPFQSGFVTLKADEIGKLYNTMAGVGIESRFAPKVEKRGIHAAWLALPALAVVLGFLWLFTHLGYISRKIHDGFQSAFIHGAQKAESHSFIKVPPLPPVPDKKYGYSKMFHYAANDPPPDDTNGVYCTGYAYLGGTNVLVFLSDGRTANSLYGDVQEVRREKVTVFNTSYEIRAYVPTNVFPSAVVPAVVEPLVPTEPGVLASAPSLQVIVMPRHQPSEYLHHIGQGIQQQERLQNNLEGTQ